MRNSCGSESRKGERKPTVEPSTGTWKESMRNQAGEKGETEEARAETGTGTAAVRQNREEKGTKGNGSEGERPKARAQGKHLRNSCGSESGKGERKPSAKPSTGIWKEDTGN